jgi:DNA-binding response OmpR family regulator
VCKVLRLHFSPLELPILLVSARSGEADALAALDKDVNDFLLKPLRRMELQARINRQVGGGTGSLAPRTLPDMLSSVAFTMRTPALQEC